MGLEVKTEIKEEQPVKPKEINLVLGHGRVLEAQEQKPGPKRIFWFLGGGFLFLIVIGAVAIGWQSVTPSLTSMVGETPVTKAPPAPSLVDPDDPAFWLTFTDAENLFSLKYPRGATVQKRSPNPLPVAAAFKIDDPVVEFTPGAEKPGWLLTISEIQENERQLSFREWAEGESLEVPSSAQETTLGGRPALTWTSAVFPETFYLVVREEGMVFIKISINSELAEKHQVTLDKVLATLKFLPKSQDPSLGLKWVRKQFGDDWNIEYPESWNVDETYPQAGTLIFSGRLAGNRYEVIFSYPIFTDEGLPGLSLNISEWVGGEVWKLPASQRDLVETRQVRVAGTDGRIVLNYDGTARLYLWKRSGRNPSLVVVSQAEGEFNSSQMAKLLDRFAAGIR